MRRLLGDLLQIWALLRSVPWPYCLECPALINVSMDNYILVIARKHPVFRYRMEVSVIGIKMQLAESSSHGTTFLFKGRGGGGGCWGKDRGGGALTTGILVRGVPTVIDPIAPPAIRDTHLVPALPLAHQAAVRGAACFIETIFTVPMDITEFPSLVTLRMSRTLDFLARARRGVLCKRRVSA